MKLLGGMALDVDGEPVRIADRLSYKGMMLSDVPNLAVSFGYTNASWTLKMRSHRALRLPPAQPDGPEGATIVTPVLGRTAVERKPMLDFSSGYVQRAPGPHAEPGDGGAVAGPPELSRATCSRCASAIERRRAALRPIDAPAEDRAT